MPLTPADVHNVAFSKPPIGKRGYNEDEVDAFLDLVETELAKLLEENTELRDQVNALEQQLGNAQGDLAEARAQANRAPAQRRPVEEPRQTMAMAPPPPPPPPAPQQMMDSGSMGGDHHVQAAKVLGLAQEMADRLTAEAKTEADGMLGDARAKSEQLLSEARAKADGLVNEARVRAETMLNDARTRAETMERQSRDKAGALVGEAERKQNEIVGSIQREKAMLDKKIDELRTFEREYRTRLKTYLESQLRDLAGRGFAAPADPARASSTQSYTSSGYSSRADAGS
ncbi:MAG: DivIVA domain-containing protein [Actinomycetota bacterium]|nr:DivIVA domain-containing protein [Actinomycetota bacterium]